MFFPHGIKNEVMPLVNKKPVVTESFFSCKCNFSPYYSLATFFPCSQYVKHALYTHTEAIPEWRTQCTRGVIYYTELTIPRTITVSLSNRLKMAPRSVHAQTR